MQTPVPPYPPVPLSPGPHSRWAPALLCVQPLSAATHTAAASSHLVLIWVEQAVGGKKWAWGGHADQTRASALRRAGPSCTRSGPSPCKEEACPVAGPWGWHFSPRQAAPPKASPSVEPIRRAGTGRGAWPVGPLPHPPWAMGLCVTAPGFHQERGQPARSALRGAGILPGTHSQAQLAHFLTCSGRQPGAAQTPGGQSHASPHKQGPCAGAKAGAKASTPPWAEAGPMLCRERKWGPSFLGGSPAGLGKALCAVLGGPCP